MITGASFWATGNNAIAIAYDEGDDNVGRCDAGSSDPDGSGGGRVATVVVTNHGHRGFRDPTPYNHFSMAGPAATSSGGGSRRPATPFGRSASTTPAATG